MAFTNKNNKITVKGFLSSNITEVPNSSYALTFMIKVPRPAQQDRRIIYDEFMVMYVTIRMQLTQEQILQQAYQ